MQVWIRNLVLDPARYSCKFVDLQSPSSQESQTYAVVGTLSIRPPDRGIPLSPGTLGRNHNLALMLKSNPLDQVLEEKSKATEEGSCAVTKKTYSLKAESDGSVP